MASLQLYNIVPSVSLSVSGEVLTIGRRGETTARYIVFDMTEFSLQYPGGTCIGKYKRSGDKLPYALTLTSTGDQYTWSISDTDTAIEGTGLLELDWMLADGTLAKSALFQVITKKSLDDGTITPDVQPTIEEYVKQVLDKVSTLTADTITYDGTQTIKGKIESLKVDLEWTVID